MPAAQLHPIQAVLGSDDVEVKRLAKLLAEELTPPGDFSADVIDGQSENSEQAAQRIYQTMDALKTFGFFGGEKLVWLKNANFFADDRTGNAQATTEALEKLTELLQAGLAEGVRFLLSAGSVDKRRSFYKVLGKVAEVQVHDRVDSSKDGWEGNASMLVREAAKARGVKFGEEALEVFTLFTGGDRRTILNEMEKLDLFLGPERREVTADDVRLITPLSRAGIIFELGNALATRQLQRALKLLKQLLFQGESEVGILLATIIPTVRNLMLVKDLFARHKLSKPAQPFFFGKQLDGLPAAATAHLPRTKEGKLSSFPLGIAAQNVNRFTLPELQAGLKACLEANVSLVSAPTDGEVILCQLLVRLIAS